MKPGHFCLELPFIFSPKGKEHTAVPVRTEMFPLIFAKNTLVCPRKKTTFPKKYAAFQTLNKPLPFTQNPVSPSASLGILFPPISCHVPSSPHHLIATCCPIAMATNVAKSHDSSQCIQQSPYVTGGKESFLCSPYLRYPESSIGSAHGKFKTWTLQVRNNYEASHDVACIRNLKLQTEYLYLLICLGLYLILVYIDFWLWQQHQSPGKNAAERKGIYFPVNLLHTLSPPWHCIGKWDSLSYLITPCHSPCGACAFLWGCVFLILSPSKQNTKKNSAYKMHPATTWHLMLHFWRLFSVPRIFKYMLVLCVWKKEIAQWQLKPLKQPFASRHRKLVQKLANHCPAPTNCKKPVN